MFKNNRFGETRLDNTEQYGPITKISQQIHSIKYRGENENFYDAMSRIAASLADNEKHRKHFKQLLLSQRFMPGGRIQSAIGSPRRITPFNCFVSGTIEDSMDSIMQMAKESAQTMRKGGGIGYDFSNIRPKGELIKTLESSASGPVSFMYIFDAVCTTIASAGQRRGAQMAVLRIDHPDIEEFVRCKQNENELTQFNISVAVTDDFMRAMSAKKDFDLVFKDKVYKTIDAAALWDEIMRSNWDWAEPGVLYIDKINDENNLYYCEDIHATNPCGEQPLPPYGNCLLGSVNLTKYLDIENNKFLWEKYENDIPTIIRAMDNVIDKAVFPLKKQEIEAKNKRRMGIGITGLANAGEFLGFPYASNEFLIFTKKVIKILRDESYKASALLADEKGSFPSFDKEKYLNGKFIKRLPKSVVELIEKYGIRNSHLISIAPTGTISLSADNCSSAVEPVFAHEYERKIQNQSGFTIEKLEDYGKKFLGIEGRTVNDITAFEHLSVLTTIQYYVDSAVSKTCNVGDNVNWEDFKEIYKRAWVDGAKGVTTFRASGKRFGILNKTTETCASGSCDT